MYIDLGLRRKRSLWTKKVRERLLAVEMRPWRRGEGLICFNCATGKRTTLNKTFDALKPLTGYRGSAKYGPERGGDIKHSLADITQAQAHLGYKVLVNFEDGLRRTVEWYKSQAQPVAACAAQPEQSAGETGHAHCGLISVGLMTPGAAHPQHLLVGFGFFGSSSFEPRPPLATRLPRGGTTKLRLHCCASSNQRIVLEADAAPKGLLWIIEGFSLVINFCLMLI